MFLGSSTCYGEEIFEVKATAVNSVIYGRGKIEKDSSGSQVVYVVNIPEKRVTRTAVYNAGPKDAPGVGLESDNTIY